MASGIHVQQFTAPQQRKHLMLSPIAMHPKRMNFDPDEPVSPATPAGKRKGTWDDDCCSTALPSPWTGPDSPSPWPSPAMGGSWGSPAPMRGSRGSPGPQALVSCANFVLSDLAGCLEMDFADALALQLPPVPEGNMRPGSPCDTDMVFPVDPWSSPSLWTPGEPLLASSELLFTPPASPLITSREVVFATPHKPVRSRSPRAPCKAALPSLLSALQNCDLDGVRRALETDPECAQFPFWEHALEPPLCAAVRLGCGLEIIQLLVDHDAAVNAVDAKGRAPLDILMADTCRWGSMPFNDEIVDGSRIAEMLTQAGATESQESSDNRGGDSGPLADDAHRTPLPAMPQFYSQSAAPRKLF